MVSIAAFQAVDPGSIPGRRKFHVFFSGREEAGGEGIGEYFNHLFSLICY